MPLILRGDLKRKMSAEELDQNFTYLESISGGGTGSGGVGPTGPAGADGLDGATGPAGSGGTGSLPDEFDHTNSTSNLRLVNISNVNFGGFGTGSVSGALWEGNNIIVTNVVGIDDDGGGTVSNMGYIDLNTGLFNRVETSEFGSFIQSFDMFMDEGSYLLVSTSSISMANNENRLEIFNDGTTLSVGGNDVFSVDSNGVFPIMDVYGDGTFLQTRDGASASYRLENTEEYGAILGTVSGIFFGSTTSTTESLMGDFNGDDRFFDGPTMLRADFNTANFGFVNLTSDSVTLKMVTDFGDGVHTGFEANPEGSGVSTFDENLGIYTYIYSSTQSIVLLRESDDTQNVTAMNIGQDTLFQLPDLGTFSGKFSIGIGIDLLGLDSTLGEEYFTVHNNGGIDVKGLVGVAMGGTFGFASDAFAGMAGVPIGGMYHNQGNPRVRVV